MKTVCKLFSIAAALTLFLVLQSCDKAKDIVKGEYQTGVLVVNEGGFGKANGDITYYNPSADIVEQNVFKKLNGEFAGDVLQSVSIDGDDGYLVLNGSNKIEVVDINTMKRKNTFVSDKLIKPRYLKVVNGKAYITVWGPYDENYSLINSFVLVVDTKTGSVVNTIDTSEGVEHILFDGKYLFVSRNGFSESNAITVIDPATDKIVKEINLSGEPRGMVLDANQKLWAVAPGGTSKLFRINAASLEVEQAMEIGFRIRVQLAISPDRRNLYCASIKAVYKMNVDATALPDAPLFSPSDVTVFYGMSVDPKTGDIYIGDAKDYASAGRAHIFTADGNAKKVIETGISPNSFVFR